ncbi:MAG: hypothetical protein KGI50_03805 [Patescibacteria group bacterium]|nr:hypothetical protein [Patescibacteria group bacterium]
MNHYEKYIDSFIEYCLPKLRNKFVYTFFAPIRVLFKMVGILRLENDFSYDDISLRTTVFIDEARKQGITCAATRTPFGYTNEFVMRIGKRSVWFEGLPCTELSSSKYSSLVDDKAAVKKILAQQNIITPEGKNFWFFQKKQAFRYGLSLGFPLMVKPRSGSISHHITTHITSEQQLEDGIERALRYEPCVIVEQYLPNMHVFRATVIDGDFVACVERIPAHVVGDGINTVQELVAIKNADSRRKKSPHKNTTHYHIILDATSDELLKEQGMRYSSVPSAGEIVVLQKKVILDLGADIIELTHSLHPDNIELFKNVANLFGMTIVGIDFIGESVARSWKDQVCAIIELNSLPYIDMHHYPYRGQPQNIAGAILKMALKYYA